MNILKQTGWWIYATLATILTLGLFARFHLITVRKRNLGGVRAGVLGCTHVYKEIKPAVQGNLGGAFLVISTWYGKKRYPTGQIAYADTKPLTVHVASTGAPMSSLATWQTRTVASFVNALVKL